MKKARAAWTRRMVVTLRVYKFTKQFRVGKVTGHFRMFISQKMTKIVCLYETHRPQRPPRHQEKPGTSAGAETAAEQAAEVHQCNYQINLSIGSFPVFRRRNTRVSLEVFPESELFGEAQAGCDFFHRQVWQH